jgi:hypothetical protein
MRTRVLWLLVGASIATVGSTAWARVGDEDDRPKAVQAKKLGLSKARNEAREYVAKHIPEGFLQIYGQPLPGASPSNCKREGAPQGEPDTGNKHVVLCRFHWERQGPSSGTWDLRVKMKHKRDIFGKASYPVSVERD